MTEQEEQWIEAFWEQKRHTFRELERYARLMEKQVPNDRQTTF